MSARPLALAVGLLLLAGCSLAEDKANEVVDSAKDEVGSAVDQAKATAGAEALATAIEARQKPSGGGLRSAAALQQVVDALPGDLQVSGITDGDGDGSDDDGRVQVTVGRASSCLALPATGTATEVVDGAC